MNLKKAKALRRKIYGDTSLKIQRRYVINRITRVITNMPGTPRAMYQEAKRILSTMAQLRPVK